ARSAAARGDTVTCAYTPELAEQLRIAYPEADADGDGVVTQTEACSLQIEVRRRRAAEPVVVEEQFTRMADELLAEPLCCNCQDSGCNQDEGVNR
ncbi:MAG: hypothetical protein KIT31_41870, partial [Deltaproteobacteria bacterium]|nr:hypothetical protein [Deltaproteobacteria bacterium]